MILDFSSKLASSKLSNLTL